MTVALSSIVGGAQVGITSTLDLVYCRLLGFVCALFAARNSWSAGVRSRVLASFTENPHYICQCRSINGWDIIPRASKNINC